MVLTLLVVVLCFIARWPATADESQMKGGKGEFGGDFRSIAEFLRFSDGNRPPIILIPGVGSSR